MKGFFIIFILTSSLLSAKIVPSFNTKLLDGTRVSLSDLTKENKLLFLSFWSTWCTACIEELKKVSEYISKNPKTSLEVFTINVDTSETSSQIIPTLRLYELKFRVALDPKHEIFEKYQKSKELPFSVLIDSKKNIIKTFKGYNENLFSEIESVVKEK